MVLSGSKRPFLLSRINLVTKMSCGKDYFDIRKAHEFFLASLIGEDDVDIKMYLEAYNEIKKFCSLLGSVFSFVGTEIHSKSDIMHELRKNCQEEHFDTLKKMIEYEKGTMSLNEKEYVSGCRTFLRLHRGLDFIRTFLKRVVEIEIDENTSHVGSEVYSETLAKYHCWIIRQAAYVAMNFLPTKRSLLVSVCGKEWGGLVESLPGMLGAADEVYRRTQYSYEINDLLNLP